MTILLHTIKTSTGSIRKKKRLGRGNSSGKGTYSGKGLKGQKSRSGVSNLKRIGMKQILLRIPKKRGFKSLQAKKECVNLFAIDQNFSNNNTINPQILVKKGLISNIKVGVKILGNGDLKLKGLKFEHLSFSDTAKEKINKAGGEIIS